MLKNFLRSITPPLHLSRSRGQAMVFWALLVPIFVLFTGLGMDLGWYYLNVSRLQNAADAAALAGARTIINSNSGKLKDLAPVLVQKLPADNGLTDDGEPKVETSTSTETSQTSTETDEGTTITTTETTTTTTTTISKTKLEDLTWTDGDATARNYTAKNIGTMETASLITDAWNISDSPEDKKVDTDSNLVKVNGDFYYIVTLDENIRHFFLSGWFGGMDAKVVAIAQLVPKDQVVVDTNRTTKTWEEFIAKVREIINKNVIVGNWEVQNKYKNNGGGKLNTSDLNITDPKTGEQVKFLDSNGNERTQVTAYEASFGTEVYSDAWNHFQDFHNHYYLGDLYRKENVVIKDDVLFNENANGSDIIDRNKNKGTITSYGAGQYGESSSVAATAASVNTDKNNLAYNPERNTWKTYQNGITERGNVGLPYTWKRVDSINIDFRVEYTLSGKWLSEDWDLELGFSGVSVNNTNKTWETSGSEANNIRYDDVKRLRIHSSVDFEDPYKVRPDVDTDSEPDILWARIESEPMLYHPDIMNRVHDSSSGVKSKLNQTGLNSVNQIILNFNQSNYDTSSQRYRPVIIFYDGPETYSIYSDYDTVNKFVRKSKPIIVNMNAPYRAVLYAPNSPVVVTGDHMKDFRGFIVAKNYMRLKDDNDFIDSGEVRYFNNPSRQYEYERKVKSDGTIYFQNLGGTKIDTSITKDEQVYRLKVYYAKDDPETDPAKKKRYYKVYGKNSDTSRDVSVTIYGRTYTYFTDENGMKYIKTMDENEIGIYVDDYGDIQYAELDVQPTNCGVYDTFGRTDFTTHDYQLQKESASNLLLSGN